MTQPKLHVKNLSKRFGSKIVLDGVNLSIAPKESLVIIGGSGSGKSVLIKNILGLIAPDSGEILLDGTSVIGLPSSEREVMMHKFGMLFQGGALFDSLRVWQNIAFELFYNEKWEESKARALAIEKLESVGLSAREADMYPAELSGGMQKRVSLARAICGNPEIIFFDEPTTGLDPIMADVINDLIVKCTKELGLTTLTITHDMHSATKIADRVTMLYQGKIIWEDSVKFIHTSKNAYVDQFVHGRAHGPITDDRKHAS